MVRNATWARNGIDQLVLARLEQKGVTPSVVADRESLIRRASFDLIGLPPTAKEIDDFLADKSPGAFARVVDRLLQSRQFGEHWGKYWLDNMHYADIGSGEWSAVHENAWRYRDYVIDAFNADKPYDEFIREQLAGDLLPGDADAVNQERLIATGFLELGARVRIDPKRTRLIMDLVDEQIEVTSRVFLGLTVACARCHDHKTDPIPMREYYAMAGRFTSTASLAEGLEQGRHDLRWQERSLATTEQMRELSEFETRFDQLKEQLQEARQMKIAFPGEVDSTRLAGVVVDNLAAEITGAWKESNYSTNFVDRNYLHDGDGDKGKKTARFVPELPNAGLYEVMVSYTPRANRATNVPVAINCQDGTKTVFVNQTLAPTIDKVFASVGKFRFASGTNASVVISNAGTKGFVVVDAVRFVPLNPDGSAMVAGAQPDPEQALLNYHDLERQVLEYRSKKPILPQAMAVQEGRIRDGRLRSGGDPDRQGEEVPRGFLSALGTPDSTLCAITDEGSGRLELAHWIANAQNPLTARVLVNRVWERLFAEGFVATANDFGTAGERPTYPELLDYLARRFMDQGWSLKKFVREIMLSSTYQMSNSQRDTQPLTFRTPRRLEPNMLRDAALLISGEFDPSDGGTWMLTNNAALAPMQMARRVQTDSLRRTVYMPVIRDFTPDALRGFDSVPSGSSARNASRFLEQRSRAWADSLQNSVPDDPGRITIAYRQLFGRPPSAEEMARAQALLQTAKRDQSDSAELNEPWERLCLALLREPGWRVLN
jgi:hypothetical protein